MATGAYAVARTQSWPADVDQGNRLFRAWLVSQMATMANLGPRPVTILQEGDHRYDVIASELGPGARYEVDVKPSQRADNLEWQTAIATGLCGVVASMNATERDPKGILFLRSLMPKPGQTVRISTVDGGPAHLMPTVGGEGLSDAGQIGVVEGIVIVAVVAAVGATIGWITSQVAEVVSVGLQQHGKTSQAVAAMTEASEMIEKHQAKETAEGRDLNYDAEQIQLLQTLRETIKGTTGWTAPDLKSVPDIKGATGSIGVGLGMGQFFFGHSPDGRCSSSRKHASRKDVSSWRQWHNGEPRPAHGSVDLGAAARCSG
jgi:hypothetical protein